MVRELHPVSTGFREQQKNSSKLHTCTSHQNNVSWLPFIEFCKMELYKDFTLLLAKYTTYSKIHPTVKGVPRHPCNRIL